MSELIHLSDLHFGAQEPAVVEALRRTVVKLSADLIVVSGDLTQRARRRQFGQARQFLNSLGAPTFVVPGNHDIPLFNLPARLLHPFRGYRQAFGAHTKMPP